MPRNILDLQQKGLLQLKTNSPKSTEEHNNIQFTAVNVRKRQDQNLRLNLRRTNIHSEAVSTLLPTKTFRTFQDHQNGFPGHS